MTDLDTIKFASQGRQVRLPRLHSFDDSLYKASIQLELLCTTFLGIRKSFLKPK